MTLAEDPRRFEGASRVAPLGFRPAQVLRTEFVTPRMRRVVLAGPDLADLVVPADALGPFVKLLLPDGAGPVAWPAAGLDGRLAWPAAPGGRRPVSRTYTIRHADPAARTLTLDMVLHETGVATGWARTVEPGAPVGLWGPGVTLPPATDWWLVAGDHAALPAIAGLLEGLGPDARGRALIEVPDAGEEQALRHPPGIEVAWLHRPGPDRPSRLAEVLRAAPVPPGARAMLFAGAEAAVAREIRLHGRRGLGLPRERVHVLAYWKRGAAEGAFDYAA